MALSKKLSLTLAQLYFVAYQGRIFVYRPRAAAEHLLARFPDVQLVPGKSKSGGLPGTIDPRRPHTINHIITGMLGDCEVVVAAYDNGEVVAYNVNLILKEIEQLDRSAPQSVPQPHATTQPFLHDNVGDSAWGLAVHGQSRLIAVSSNLKQVTVFAFALRGFQGNKDVKTHAMCEGCHDVESQVRKRARMWRIVITMAQGTENLPNVSFLDDVDGEADKICAVDILGSSWIAHIWKPAQPIVQLTQKSRVGLQ